MKKILQIIGVCVGSILLVTFILAGRYASEEKRAGASIPDGQAYVGTTTKAADGTALANYSVLKGGPGVFGSVVITGANTGVMYFFDATTTDKTVRTNQSTTTLATIPASAAAGTYTFDVQANYGIVYQLVSGVAPTGTVTTR
jgi:hypothetical protein